MNFKVGILQISTSQDVPLELPLWVENLKDTDFEIHILLLFLIVLGDHWELEARRGTVRKLSFYTFRKNKHFSFLKTFSGWKMWKTKRPLPQNTTFSESKLATSESMLSKCLKKSRNIEFHPAEMGLCTDTVKERDTTEYQVHRLDFETLWFWRPKNLVLNMLTWGREAGLGINQYDNCSV